MAAKTQTSRNGFTLIEVLVVVAIIALLVSILLPSLAKAREESRRAVCSAHLGSLLKAEYMYQTQNQAWIPGSPLTTGYYFAISPGATPNWGGMGTGARFNRFAINWYDYPTPLRVIMSGASSIRGPKGPADAEETRAQLFKEGVSGVFQCPSNASQTASPFPVPPGASPWEVTPAVSYMTMWNIIRGGSGVIKNIPTIYAGSTGAYETDIAQRDDWDLMVPPDYVPKHNKLGQESTKVFLADGTRYWAPAELGITYNTGMKGSKLAHSATPPSTVGDYGREYVVGRRYSYRHGDKDKINNAFFDGHVEAMTVSGHRVTDSDASTAKFRGVAVHPKYYYPSKTVVKDPTQVHNPNGQPLPVNLVLP